LKIPKSIADRVFGTPALPASTELQKSLKEGLAWKVDPWCCRLFFWANAVESGWATSRSGRRTEELSSTEVDRPSRKESMTCDGDDFPPSKLPPARADQAFVKKLDQPSVYRLCRSLFLVKESNQKRV